MTIPELTIASHNGAPCLHVNGQPANGLGFWHAPIPKGKPEWQLFARCGVHLFQLDVPAWPTDPTADMHSVWDDRLGHTLEADPQARIWLRIATRPAAWWTEANPGHEQIHYDQNNGDEFRTFVAYGSGLWRDATATYLQRLVDYMEERWPDRIWIYQVNGGDCGEWAYSWKPVVSGYAPAQVAAWRDWLRERYDNDAAALREHWQDPQADVDTAAPPAWQTRLRPENAWPPASHLIDPAEEPALVDWLTFHGRCQAEALAELAAATRRAIDRLGRRKLVSAFHGYHFWPYGAAYGPCNTGFSDLDPVLKSPDIDLLCTPLAYIHRNPGGLYSHHNLAASIRLNGKLFYTEDDTFTQLANWTPWRYCCRDAQDTLNILRRNLAGALAEGAAQWWMDHDSGGWYMDAELEAGVGNMRECADAALTYERTPCAEVALITNERSFRILRQEPALIDRLWPKTQTELLRIGAPLDVVRVRDLELAERQGDAARWKFVVVAGCLWLAPDERRLLERILLCRGRHLLFLHAQGICDGTCVDPGLTGELTGINLKAYPHGGPCRGEMVCNGSHLSWGTDKEIAPILYAEDDGAEILGWLERQYYPALVRKAHSGWTALWSGVPGLPWNLLGHFAEQAGVHRYLDDGSQVMANAGLLAVHPAGDGNRTLRLPGPRRLVDAVSGEDHGVVGQLALDLRRGETRIWHQAQTRA